MMELGIYLTAFSIGFLGSLHCLGMCGGISGALAMGMKSNNNSRQLILYNLCFNLGRVSTYALLGVVAGIFGVLLYKALGPVGGLVFRSISGIILILLGLHLCGIKSGLGHLEKVGARFWGLLNPLVKKLIPTTSAWKAYIVGLFWGGLPCGLVYSTLIYAITQGAWNVSALLMVCFGLGTIPAMFSTTLLFRKGVIHFSPKSLNRIGGCLIIIFGIWTLFAACKMQISGCHHMP